jgi:hypothetical protein
MVTGRPSICGLLQIIGLGNEFQRSLEVSSSSWSAVVREEIRCGMFRKPLEMMIFFMTRFCVCGRERGEIYVSWLFVGLFESKETEGEMK